MSTKEYANSSKYQKSPQFVFHWFLRCQFPLGLHVIQLESFKHPFWLVGWCVGWLVGWLVSFGGLLHYPVCVGDYHNPWLWIQLAKRKMLFLRTTDTTSFQFELKLSEMLWSMIPTMIRITMILILFQQLPPEFPRSVHRWMDFLIDCGSMFHLRALVYPIKSP